MTIVFIGMETSGALRRRFQAAGYETYSCDTLPSEDGGEEMAYTQGRFGQTPLGRHMIGDVFETLENMRANDMAPALGIFHPTCTYLTISAEWAYKDPDFARYPGVGYHQNVKPETLVGSARREARERALDDVRRLMALSMIKILENPVGVIGSRIKTASQSVQPFDFGDDASKRTCLWMLGKDNLDMPELHAIADPAKRFPGRWVEHNGKMVERWSNQTDAGQNRLSPGEDRWKDRSRTFDGIADALVERCITLLRSRGL